MADLTLSADINADVSGFTSGVSKAEASTESFKQKCSSVGKSSKAAGDEVDGAGNSVKGFGDKCKGAGSGASGLTSKFSALKVAAGNLAADLAGRAIDAVAGLAGEMVAASDSAEKFRSTLDFAGLDSGTIDSLLASTQEYADKTVYDLADVRNTTAQLAANGVKDYDRLAMAAGNLNAVAGGTADTYKSVGMVLTQTAGQGKLTTENWNQLADAIPGASGKLQEALKEAGAYTGNFREAMEKGEISASEFNDAIMSLGFQDAAVEAAESTSTIEGALGNLQAAFVGVGAGAVDAFKPLITGAMTQLGTFVSSVPGLLAPLGTAIQTALSGGGTEGVATAVSSLFSGILGYLTTGVQTLAAQLPMVMQTVVPLVLSSMTSLLTTVLTQLPTLLMSLLGLVVTGIASFAQTVAAQLPTIVPQLLEAAGTALNEFAGQLAAQLPTMLTQVSDAALSAVSELVNQVMTNLPTYAGQMVDAALTLFQGIVDALPETLPKVMAGVGELVGNVLTNLPTFVGQMLDAAVRLFTGIVDAIPEVVPAVLDGIAALLGKVWDAVSNFDLLGAGKDLIQGLIDGITSMGGAIIDAIGGVVGGAIDWAKGMLGIASPSKLFRSFGDYTMQGLALGIEDGASDALGAMGSAVRSVAREASSGLVVVPARLKAEGTAASVAMGGLARPGRYAPARAETDGRAPAAARGGRTVYQTINNRIVRTNDDLYVAAAIMSRSNLSAAMGV